jgi:excinuclease UvrABC ATPase subunit
MAYTLHSLSRLKWVMQQSLAKTLAHKHKTAVRKIYKQYQTESEGDGKRYKVLQAIVPREGKKPLVATWGGIRLTWDRQAIIEDRPQWKWSGRSELEKRLLAQVCEVCEATRLTDQIEVHVRRFGGRGRAHRQVRELLEGSLYTPLTLPLARARRPKHVGKPCRGKSPIF